MVNVLLIPQTEKSLQNQEQGGQRNSYFASFTSKRNCVLVAKLATSIIGMGAGQ